MTATIMDFRVREEMAGAVLKEVGALEPAERLQESETLTQIMSEAVQGLEKLWDGLHEPLQVGVSPSDAATLARILTRSANLMGSCLELLVSSSDGLQAFRQTTMMRLERIKARAASLGRLVAMSAPTLDTQRLARGLDQMARDDGVDAHDFLTQLNG